MWFELIEETFASGDHSSLSTDLIRILAVPPPQQAPSEGCCSTLTGVQEGLMGLRSLCPFCVLFASITTLCGPYIDDRVVFLTISC